MKLLQQDLEVISDRTSVSSIADVQQRNDRSGMECSKVPNLSKRCAFL